MGMISNRVEVMIQNSDNKTVYWDMFLDNEIETEVIKDKKLFSSYSSIDELVARIGEGFKDPWGEDEDDKNFIKSYCEDFGDDGYKRLKRQVTKIVKGLDFASAIKKIILVSNNETDEGRALEWSLFNFTAKKNPQKTGTEYVSYDTEDAKAFMKSMLK